MIEKLQKQRLSSARVLVIGDVMLDIYLEGSCSRISPEAPVPVIEVHNTKKLPGGAANVAVNVAALGAQVELLGMIGADLNGCELESLLQQSGISSRLQHLETFTTVTKQRVMAQQQQLVRVDREQSYQGVDHHLLLEAYRQGLANCDVVVLSDYAKGTLGDVQTYINMAQEAKIPVIVDPKAQDFSCYEGATLVTPNLKEFENIVGPCVDQADMVMKARSLMKKHQLQGLLVTLGHRGMLLVPANAKEMHMPAQAREVYDVTGAGDTVIGVLAASLAAGCDLVAATQLANVAAGIVVTKLGSASVSLFELQQVMRGDSSQNRVLSETELLLSLAQERSAGERIVMTNGCFDLLHSGHIQYLEEAKLLGDRLVVAVNDDASTRRLKGEDRPVNSLLERMSMLAALRCVDWVVAFAEDTPARLIAAVLPDILVKGGDYEEINKIAGAQAVLQNGGEVKLLSFKPGYSTTKLIHKIQKEVA